MVTVAVNTIRRCYSRSSCFESQGAFMWILNMASSTTFNPFDHDLVRLLLGIDWSIRIGERLRMAVLASDHRVFAMWKKSMLEPSLRDLARLNNLKRVARSQNMTFFALAFVAQELR